MEFRTLGPIELWAAAERRGLGSARARSLLAMLLLTPRTLVPSETLIDRLWDRQPPDKARESLSVYMARLRASLREAVGDEVRLVGRTHGGYLLEVDPDAIDLHRFRRLHRQGAALRASGNHADAAELLYEADALWRGQALAGIRGEWVTRMREVLEEERRAAIIERIGCELELGRHSDLVGELGNLLTRYPLDETLVAHQMTALYRTGRQADALRFYREFRRRLIEEQGTEPGAMLSELHLRMLGGDLRLSVSPAGRHAIRRAVPDTLPVEVTDFVGRDHELALLTGKEGGNPTIAIIEGMPGVGKTTLALRAARLVAERYPDGMIHLNLQSHDLHNPSLQPAEALHRLLRKLSVPVAQIPKTLDELAVLWRAHLSRRRIVVILDDAAGREQIRPLLPVSGQCLFLITTRRRLPGFDDALTITLDVLSTDDAVSLFRKVVGESRVLDTEQVGAAVALCGRLPLAIQVAAGRFAQAAEPKLDDLIEDWSQSPAWIGGGTGTATSEVLAAFELSYRALEPDHQRFFRSLGVSPCGAHSPLAAAALADCTIGQADAALAALLDCHLLTEVADGQVRLHDLVRGYAAARARRDDPQAEQRLAVSRLLDYYLENADRADRVLHPLRRRPGVEVGHLSAACPTVDTREAAVCWLESEWRNIVEVATYAGRHEWKQQCADLSCVLSEFLKVRACWDEAVTLHDLALQCSRYLADPVRTAQASLALSEVRQQTGRHETAISLAEEAGAIYRSLADTRGEAESLDHVGLAHQRTARSREALAYFRQARILFEAAGDSRGVADTLSHSGIACWHLGRYPEANSQLLEALSRYRDLDDLRGEAKVLNNLGRVHLYNGQYGEALAAYQRSLQIFRRIGGPQNEAILYHAIGSVHCSEGKYQEALSACRRALTIYRDIGDLPDEADVLNDIGVIYQSAACYDEAFIHHQKAQLIAEKVGDLSQQLIALRMIADLERGAGRPSEALEQYYSALKLAREIGNPYEEGKILEGIAELTLYTERRDVARIVFRQALDIFERLGVPEAESARTRIEAIDPPVSAPTAHTSMRRVRAVGGGAMSTGAMQLAVVEVGPADGSAPPVVQAS
jgi:DNA-binding SARP family transcriptional activator/tetratricopeptide (TPR) repeat protein